MNHEDGAAELHGQYTDQGTHGRHMSVDMSGAPLPISEKEAEVKDEFYDKRGSDVTSENYTGEDGTEPGPEDRQTLRRIGDSMPLATWLVAIVELAERFTYYGASGLFPNYILKPLDGSLGRGALGLSQQATNGLTTFFQFFCYVTPILGAIIADQYLGRYKTIAMFMVVYIIGLLILLLTSLPVALENGAGLGGFITALIVIGFGTGGIKSNVAPLIADQYQRRKMAIKTLKSGERVIIDPAITMQRIYMVFYWCINLGSLSLIATPYMEQDIGFWSAYLMCLCMFVVGFAVLIFARKYYVVRPPQGGIIVQALRVIGQMIKARNRDAPKPSYKVAHGKPVTNTWDDHFVEEVKRALIACQVFVFYPVYWVAYGQFSNNFVVQALEMRLHGIPNDLMQNFDPISIIVFIPILDRLVYPALRKRGILLRPVTRIVIGFFIASMAMLYAAVLQYKIYQTGPCFENPLYCDAGYPRIPGTNRPDTTATHIGNDIHVAVQTPAYVLIGLSEIFISVTGLEYAYTKSPPSMKSFVQSMYLLTNAFGSAISEALVPTATDPRYQWLYVGICVACFITGTVFWFTFKHLNAQEEALNELSKDDPVLRRGSAIRRDQEDTEQNFGTGAASAIPIGDGKKI